MQERGGRRWRVRARLALVHSERFAHLARGAPWPTKAAVLIDPTRAVRPLVAELAPMTRGRRCRVRRAARRAACRTRPPKRSRRSGLSRSLKTGTLARSSDASRAALTIAPSTRTVSAATRLPIRTRRPRCDQLVASVDHGQGCGVVRAGSMKRCGAISQLRRGVRLPSWLAALRSWGAACAAPGGLTAGMSIAPRVRARPSSTIV
jgi:hypothetical protein